MKKGILILLDLNENVSGILDYALQLAKEINYPINLLHCYSKLHYNRKFNFPEKPYSEGIISMMKEIMDPYIKQDQFKDLRINYISRQGQEIDIVADLSENYSFMIMRTQLYSNSINKFLSSNIPSLSASSKCPILVVPPQADFSGLNNCWLISRRNNDFNTMLLQAYHFGLPEDRIKVKTFNQNKYSSNLWKLLNSSIDFTKLSNKNLLTQELKEEKVDMLFIVSYSEEGFASFLRVRLTQIIFSLGIPIFIIHKN